MSLSASDEERAALDAILDPEVVATVYETDRLVRGGTRRRRDLRTHLLPCLHALQWASGWISPGGIELLAERLGVAPAEVYGVASFYHLFRVDDPGHRDPVEHVCVDGACQLAGAFALAAQRRDDDARVKESPCLGRCERAPAILVQRVGEEHVPVDSKGEPIPQAGDPSLRLLRRVGVVDPASIDEYRAMGGFRSLRRAIDMGPSAVIDEIDSAGISGRGGAGFPTGAKWRAVAEASSAAKHVVANGDESEPGTFKDRVVMESDPFMVIESLIIAGFAVGASTGWIYVRGEYPLAASRLEAAARVARQHGLLGADVAGAGFTFDIEVRRGAGAYVCGEETALFASIEGFRGEPREKPPFPTAHGLFGAPTVVNNIETLAAVTAALDLGVDEYRRVGTDSSPGTNLVCVSGSVEVPGVFEVPFGITLGDVLELAGGATEPVQALLLGGAAGSFVGPDRLDLALTDEDARAAGLTLGSGAITVYGRSVDMLAVISRIAAFFRDESCGQCVPCRVGTQRQAEVLATIGDGEFAEALLDDIAAAMRDSSICGLGQTASSAVRSALDLGLVEVGR